MIKVGIIADSHDVMREDVLADLKHCDYIIHAGDILEQLKTITKVYAVKGNNDKLDLNEKEYFKIGNYSFY